MPALDAERCIAFQDINCGVCAGLPSRPEALTHDDKGRR
jgi:hypothetical protein